MVNPWVIAGKVYERVFQYLPPGLAARMDPPIARKFPYAWWAQPFNGLNKRVEMFEQIVENISFNAVVETGTFRGTTTEFFRHTTGLPVYSVEANSRVYQFASRRLQDDPGVTLELGDSRQFLERLRHNPDVPRERVLFYLDAHWKKDLPLREEVQLIASHWNQSVIMIDDFQVPDDADYEFTDFGNGKCLRLDYLRLDEIKDYCVFWPAAWGAEESGGRQGYIVLADEGPVCDQLSLLPTLRRG